jgi:hypothetical protein
MIGFNFTFPIVDASGMATAQFRRYLQDLELSAPIIGSGSPEGVVNARQYQLYINSAGGAGAVEYRKMLKSIGTDTTTGWILV